MIVFNNLKIIKRRKVSSAILLRMEQNQIKFLSFDDMWGIKGRIGRLHYALVMVRLVVLSFILFSIVPLAAQLVAYLGMSPVLAEQVLVLLVFIGLVLSQVSIIIRRVHDMGYPFWTVFIVFLMVLLALLGGEGGTLFTLLFMVALQVVLLSVPGDEDENLYGNPVESADKMSSYRWMKSTTQGVAIFGIIFIMAGLVILSFQRYIPDEYAPESLKNLRIERS